MAVNEILHDTEDDEGAKWRCLLLDGKGVCNCRSRDEWLQVREQWRVWHDWKHRQNAARSTTYEPAIGWSVLSIPFWPIALGIMFVLSGAKGIPDYSKIEQMEKSELSNIQPLCGPCNSKKGSQTIDYRSQSCEL